MQDRPYQTEAKNSILANYDEGVNKQLIVCATGTGKTVCFASFPSIFGDKLPGKTLVICPRRELVKQARNSILKVNPSLSVGIEMAKDKADLSCYVVVASVQSLTDKRAERYDWSLYDKIVIDEVHHGCSPSYLALYDRLGINNPNWKGLLAGFTATHQRADGQSLSTVFDKLTYFYDLRRAIEEGWLVDVRGIKVSTKVSLDKVKTTRGEYDQKQLANTVDTPIRNLLAVKAYLEYAKGMQAIGFTVNIKHAQNLAEMFQKHGVKAEAIWGTDKDRDNKLERHRNCEIQILLCCDLLSEGYDDWRIQCVLNTSPTKSPVKFAQRVGRATRLEQLADGSVPNLLTYKGDIKRYCLIVDLVDSSRHSLITLPTLMGLHSELDLNGGSLLEAVEKLEEVQEEYPYLDFSELPSIDDLESFVERVNLFDIHFSPEVEANSKFTWYPHPTGGYVLNVPMTEISTTGVKVKVRDEIRLKRNILDKWEITGYIKGKKYRGERNTIEAAFSAGDQLVQTLLTEELTLVKQDAGWHKDVATVKQLAQVRRMYPGKQVPPTLTKGAASRLIGLKKAGGKQWK